ncbi:APC family permease [Saccharopolyspora taberi]|uniref:Amino acid permease n=1 Tax=Saccharopolyspora taberi TaxID=60895 RepID=A0ABN3VDZ0_9PSEU
MNRLVRRLGTADAVVIGLGSMIGAGVFSAFAPAAAAAGSGLLAGLVIAGVVAYCNASSSAALAARYPTSGGTYVYGRERLGDWWGFTAGWGFVIGKTASCAAMALTVASYVSPAWARPLAVLAVLSFAAVNYFGVTRTARLARVLLVVTLVALGLTLVAVYGGAAGPAPGWTSGGPLGVLQAAGLLFFAFAGYARIATLGEEVRDPERTIPRAIPIALGIAFAVYALVGVGLLASLGPAALAASPAPLADAAQAGGLAWLAPAARVGAVVAGLGALLALLTGIGRTALAMARNSDLPGWLAAVHPRHRVPHHAEIVLAVVVCGLVLTVDLRGAIGFSSFGVLVYYAIANASALTLRALPRWVPVLGLAGCLLLAATLPWQSVVAGLAVFAVGLAGRAVARRS